MLMNASELFKASKLKEAIEAQTQAVKASPTDPGLRLFLFELLAFAGDLDRARRQIEAVTYDDPDQVAMLQRYKKLLDSEAERRKMFDEGIMPSFFIDPPFHLRMRQDAVMNFLRFHRGTEAQGLLEGARGMLPNLKVLLNNQEYQGFHDCDDIFGTILEVMVNGQYYWLPLEQVTCLAMNPPKFPRDLLWIPTRLELSDGRTGEVFLPALYPGSHLHPDDQVKLGRNTDWKTWEDGPVLGIGEKTFLAGEEPIGILEWRTLQVLSAE
jgi:type VI secretion system protein ImpE